MMDDHDTDFVKRILQEAMDLPQEDRSAFIAEHCGDDEACRIEIESLIHAAGQLDDPFLESPVIPALSSEILGALRQHPTDRNNRLPIIGQQVGPYEIRECLGEGGLSVVYLGLQESPIRKEVAVKVLKAGVDTEQVLTRFGLEQEILTKLGHPNIAKAIDAGLDDSVGPYFVVELVRGRSIEAFCESHRLNLNERLEVFIDACQGVHHAHMRGVIHRDLKPSNILVAEVDGIAVPKIIDFGIAKAMDTPTQSHHTRHGFPLGTPAYMSPEQWASDIDIDVRTDVYSMGILLYRILTGSMPFDTSTPPHQEQASTLASAKLKEIKGDEQSPYSAHESRAAYQSLSADLDWVILKSISHERSQRYTSIQDFVADLHRFLKHEPVLARRRNRIDHFRKFCRRRQGLAAMMGASTICVGIIIIALAINLISAKRHAKQLLQAQHESAMHASIADETVRFLTDEVLGQAAPGRLGPDANLNELLLSITPVLEDRLEDTPQLAMRVHFELGLLFALLGDDDRADTEFRLAEIGLKGTEHEYSLFAADIAAKHAVLLAQHRASHNEARGLVRFHLKTDTPGETINLLNTEDASQFRLWDAMARIDELSETPYAGIVLRQSIMEAVEHGGGFPRGQLWLGERSHYVSSLVRSGEFLQGIIAAEDLLRDAKRTKEPRTTQRVKLMLAQVYRVAGRIDEACKMSDIAADEAVKLYGPTHPITIDSFMLSTYAHDVSGRRDRAVDTAFTAYTNSSQVDKYSTRWAECSSAYARILLIADDDQSKADIVINELLGIWSPGNPAPTYFNGLSVSTLSAALRELGRVNDAIALADDVLTQLDLSLQDRFLILHEQFRALLELQQLDPAAKKLIEMERVTPTMTGWRGFAHQEAVSCAHADLLTAHGDYEAAEKILLDKLKTPGQIASRSAIAKKLADTYLLWGREEDAAQWEKAALAQVDPVILDELLRKYVEHSRD